ncbi:hypothetical protein CcaverHIS002_0303160 [Cutaneotrichosporon cavernicola]|uniref:Uncharacterized protein n=1 Tax=Cutaneotrichosporon cavernicola TaxID=279322 RepID=A0AA48L0R5_9TREE|nr:uncharacterized protein CcaverHIS019_0303160 [Cutaneotrichosporon cavernicola]BEI82448.1 hypothetical protein CcaverHIS002_0303160 [Cutaneotrichosporon cavernicola]BEI90246.1 hypothetical protein CcaverHIS019_0303160 [Cutaneotrichosporon cavernicola]BEI98023.1 hypothetical protein CcaverHIS631_0303220 [Cutaneotrichosporon cavernicola]BEJ05800.1 hypothetical protein CcaverHIS641_0303220 [Cutaneotrichosporon cavernicola]
MITFSDSETSTDGMSIISVPSSEEFEIILMPFPSTSTRASRNVDSLEASMASLGLGAHGPEEGGSAGSVPAASGPSSVRTVATTIGASLRSGGDGNHGDDEATWSVQTHRTRVTTLPSHTASILSASDARESIDSFLTDPEFTSDKANKLRLWQALCIEAIKLEESDDTLSDSLSFDSSSEYLTNTTVSDEDSDCTPTGSRSATPTQTLPQLPTSLTAAVRLLSTRGHVNILQYLEVRNDPTRHTEDVVGKYADLVYPSASALQRDMRRDRKYAKIDDVKREWLQPLLKDFGFRRRRESRV